MRVCVCVSNVSFRGQFNVCWDFFFNERITIATTTTIIIIIIITTTTTKTAVIIITINSIYISTSSYRYLRRQYRYHSHHHYDLPTYLLLPVGVAVGDDVYLTDEVLVARV